MMASRATASGQAMIAVASVHATASSGSARMIAQMSLLRQKRRAAHAAHSLVRRFAVQIHT